jgi:hypothetical protein
LKKMITATLVAGALINGLFGAGIAHADVNYDNDGTYGGGYMGDHDGYAYGKQLRHLGAPGWGANDAQDFAGVMCHDLTLGVTKEQLIDLGASTGISRARAELALHGAEFHFCPDYYA